MKSIVNFLFLIASVFLIATGVSAQSPSPSPAPGQPVSKVSDLKFPITELGSCGDYKSCLTFCDDPVNNASCVEFAKKKGFYKDDPVIAPSKDLIQKAKTALGCDSSSTCLDFCSQTANFDKCDKFAKSQNFIGGYVEDPNKQVYLDKAKEVLGCSTAGGCSSFCANPTNTDKCSKFADQVGLLGGQTTTGPGGCTSDGTCKLYCTDPANFSSCSKFAPSGGFQGPGGCNSPGSCRSHCEENPADCRSYAPGSNGVYTPVACPAGQYFGPGGVCTSNEKTAQAGQCSQGGKFWNGSSCQDSPPPGIHPTVGGAFFQPRPEMGNCSTPGSCYDYCKSNPGQCAGFSSNSEKPKDDYIPSLYYTPGTEVKFTAKADMGNCSSPGGCYDFCKSNPSKCQGFDSKSPRPSDTYMPGTYYTPPSNYTYFTPSATSFYVTPIYYTPPAGSKYTTPSYYTPGIYSSPAYYTPIANSNYTTPTYYSPGSYYATPSDGHYPTPSYSTPTYYTPPAGSNYNTPSYYSPASYVSPSYYSPGFGSNYTTPNYVTPAAYSTPTYYTPFTGGNYTTPTYYTPPAGSNYTTPNYPSPSYYTPYYSPPSGGGAYPTPAPYPTPGGTYYTPYYSPPSDSGTYYTPSSGTYSTPGTSPENYPAPPAYGTPSYATPPPYNTPSYGTPSYATPSYGTPSYGTPSYGTPGTYATPGSVVGVSTQRSIFDIVLDFLKFK